MARFRHAREMFGLRLLQRARQIICRVRPSTPRCNREEMYLRLGLKIEVELAPPASLPRFEGKGRRFVDERQRDERQLHE